MTTAGAIGFHLPAVTGGASFSTGAFSTVSTVSTVTCWIWEESGFCSLGEEGVDPTLEELRERLPLDTDLDFDLDFFSTEADLDLDLRLFFWGDLDLVVTGRGE